MPAITPSPWDSEQLGIKAGHVHDITRVTPDMLDAYDMLLAKLPQPSPDLAHSLGFEVIGTEINLQRAADTPLPSAEKTTHTIRQLRKETPNFSINGFHIADSRFMLDVQCAKRLPSDFWDRMIANHCSSYAYLVLCAVSEQTLAGFISCIRHEHSLDLFMVGVHPDHQRQGIGSALMQEACKIADEENLTLTTTCFQRNIVAMHFYKHYQFTPAQSIIVMHRWKKGLLHAA